MSSGPERSRDAIPNDVANLRDYEAHARACLSPQAWAYFAGGAADEVTLLSNTLAWRNLSLQSRVLRDLRGSHSRVELLGRTLAHPMLVAPMAYQRMAHPHGEAAMALAAAMQGAGLVLSTQASVPLEDIAALVRDEPTRGPLWFQLYLQVRRDDTLALVHRARDAGFEALVLTVDAPVSGARDRERRAGFVLPPGVTAVNLPRQSPHSTTAPLEPLLAQAATWDDVAWLRDQAGLPLLLKGITHPDDARRAVELGIDGIIVSNHGGRTLDTLPPTAHSLPPVVQAVAGRCPVLVDGGITRGTDVLKAVALGASAVLVGRPLLWALATAGATGAAHALRLLRDELDIAMALTGCRDLNETAQVLA